MLNKGSIFKWFLGVAALAILVALSWFILSQKSKQACSFTWQPQAKQIYQFKASYDIITDNSLIFGNVKNTKTQRNQKSHVVYTIEGILNFRILEQKKDLVFVGLQLCPVTIAFSGKAVPGLKKLYQTYFLVAFSRNGRPAHFYFPDSLAKEDQISLAGIVSGIQTILPPRPQKKWDYSEKDASGEYQAHYTMLKDNKIHKQKMRYLSVNTRKMASANGIELTARIVESGFQIFLSPEVSWVDKISGSEVIKFQSGNATLITARSNLELTLLPFHADPSLAIWKENRPLEKILTAFAKPAKRPPVSFWKEQRKERQLERFKGVNIMALTDKVIQAKGQPGIIDAINSLRDYLKTFPEEAEKIPDILLSADMSSSAAAGIINSLELAGNLEAQEALIDIMQNGRQTQINRVRAIVAAGGLQMPEEETINSLMQQADLGRSKNADDATVERSDTALLTLGILSDTLSKAGDSGRAEDINLKLTDYLQHAINAEDKIICLKAMGNLSNDGLLPVIEPYLLAKDPEVRLAAADSLRNLSDDHSLNLLLERLEQEPVARVRGKVFETIEDRGKGNKAAIGRVIQDLPNENDPDLRNKMVVFLGKNKKAFPGITETLKEQLASEKSPKVIKSIYKALYE